MRTSGAREGRETKRRTHSGMPRMLSCIDYLLALHRIGVCFRLVPSLLVSSDAFPPLSSSLSLFTDLFRLSLAAPDIFTASCRRVDLVCITPLLLRARLPFALQNCLAVTIYVSSDPAADWSLFVVGCIRVWQRGASFTLPPQPLPPFLAPCTLTRASTISRTRLTVSPLVMQ